MSNIELVVLGAPVPKGRPKFRRVGNFVQAYTPAKTRNAEKKIQECFKREMGDFIPPKDAKVELLVSFHMPIPSSLSKKKKRELNETNAPHLKKPDLDNLVKLVQDALNKLAWHDDGCIYCIKANKMYSDVPCTYILISYI